MPDLIAQSENARHYWRRPLAKEEVLLLGRQTADGAVSWDTQVSKHHARVCWDGNQLSVKRLPETKNSIFISGEARDEFTISPGERFVIGSTTFILAATTDVGTEDRPTPFAVQQFQREHLRSRQFREAAHRIDALARIPKLIPTGDNERELAARVVSVLLDGMTRASTASLIQCSHPADGEYDVLHCEHRGQTGGDFRPSRGLLRHAWETKECVLHLWEASGLSDKHAMAATQRPGVDWAFCLPVGGDGVPWHIYVEGGLADSGDSVAPEMFEDDLKFVEIVSSTLANIRSARFWERRHAQLRPFFSPSVLDWLDQKTVASLDPGQADVSVLFCDLRGFSRESELSADDLVALLHRVSRALGVMTHEILKQGGVIGDFHGDAAMGFWGWPMDQPSRFQDACLAALSIRRKLGTAESSIEPSLPGFRAGIGLASGPAVAGPIGTDDQLKVSVFGPVVNRAARLESLTKVLKAAVLIDEPTANTIRERVPWETARLRRIGRVALPQMPRTETVFELLPPQSQMPELSDDALEAFEAALTDFERGDWDRAFSLLHRVPHQDHVKDFLIWRIVSHDRRAPEDWDGILRTEP